MDAKKIRNIWLDQDGRVVAELDDESHNLMIEAGAVVERAAEQPHADKVCWRVFENEDEQDVVEFTDGDE